METVVREMAASEASQVTKIGRRAFQGFESLWVPKPKKALVAVQNDKIVGAILYKFLQANGKKIGYVDYAFVDPGYHNQGVGNVLYKAATDYLWGQGCDALSAIVKDDNVGSWGLFLKNGFQRVSLPELTQQFGFMGAVKQYFCTPLWIGVGMEYYVAFKDQQATSHKEGTAKQIFTYLFANVLLTGLAVISKGEQYGAFLAAYVTLLILLIIAGYVGTLFSKRGWKYRLNNGGAVVSALVNISGVYPMVGNWYPEKYENTNIFRRDIGIVALVEWVILIAVMVFTTVMGGGSRFLLYLGQISAFFLVYRLIPFYPFESFGGRRLYQWNKWLFAATAALSVGLLAYGVTTGN